MPSFPLMVPRSTMARRRRPIEIASMITIGQPTAQTHSAMAKTKALWEGLVGVAELDERTDDECVVKFRVFFELRSFLNLSLVRWSVARPCVGA